MGLTLIKPRKSRNINVPEARENFVEYQIDTMPV